MAGPRAGVHVNFGRWCNRARGDCRSLKVLVKGLFLPQQGSCMHRQTATSTRQASHQHAHSQQHSPQVQAGDIALQCMHTLQHPARLAVGGSGVACIVTWALAAERCVAVTSFFFCPRGRKSPGVVGPRDTRLSKADHEFALRQVGVAVSSAQREILERGEEDQTRRLLPTKGRSCSAAHTAEPRCRSSTKCGAAAAAENCGGASFIQKRPRCTLTSPGCPGRTS